METNNVLKVTAVLTIFLVTPLTACAQNNGRRQGPPPEAIEACENKNAGDSVSFTGRRGESLEATCQEMDGQLVAVPEDMPPGGGRH